MRTGRNSFFCATQGVNSLDHWDMRTGRNHRIGFDRPAFSLDHWDMRTGRNTLSELLKYL